MIVYCILRERIKGFNSATYAIKCQQVVIALWLGSYRMVEYIEMNGSSLTLIKENHSFVFYYTHQ